MPYAHVKAILWSEGEVLDGRDGLHWHHLKTEFV